MFIARLNKTSPKKESDLNHFALPGDNSRCRASAVLDSIPPITTLIGHTLQLPLKKIAQCRRLVRLAAW